MRRRGVVALGVVVAAPLTVLVVRAAADVWRAPAVLPQRVGTRGLEHVLSDTAGTATAAANSLVVAVAATAVAVAIGWPAARTLAASRGRRRTWLFLAIGAPLLVPPFAVGTGLVTWLLRLGGTDTLVGLVASHLVYVVPYVTLLLAPAFGPEVDDLEEAAAVMGAPRWTRLRTVTVPAVAPSLGVAALLGFLVSWSQYGTSLAVGGGIPMLPVALVPFVGSDPQLAAALSLVFVTPPLLALVGAVGLGRRAV